MADRHENILPLATMNDGFTIENELAPSGPFHLEREKAMTKKEIIERLRALGEKPNAKATKGHLEALLKAVEKRKAAKQQPTESHASAKKATHGEGVKAVLFRLFPRIPILKSLRMS